MSTGIDLEQLATELKADEGFRDRIYTCSAGKLTIGYGFNLEDSRFPERIADLLLLDEIGRCLAECERFEWFYPLSGVRKRVILNMVYNLGWTGVNRFKKMIAAIEDQDWEYAAIEMLDSKWHSDVGARAERLAQMMREDR